jgi:hypothetical protein
VASDPAAITQAALQAIARHERLKNEKVLDLVLGSMVAQDGITAVRAKLQWYIDHLA